jgi:hypothetical protein
MGETLFTRCCKQNRTNTTDTKGLGRVLTDPLPALFILWTVGRKNKRDVDNQGLPPPITPNHYQQSGTTLFAG